jgi:glyoxylate/hydroxypyruvate reductase
MIPDEWDCRLINEMTICILGGCGKIGSYIARMLTDLGAKVVAFGRSKRDELFLSKSFHYLSQYSTQLEQVLPQCDYLLNVMPSTPDTIGLLNGNKLKLCEKKNACFINIGRASVIDESELITALDNGWIDGAILDVFPVEPLPTTSQLWHRNQVIITPHIAAVRRSQDVAHLFAFNYQQFVLGENASESHVKEEEAGKKELKYVIDWKQGY